MNPNSPICGWAGGRGGAGKRAPLRLCRTGAAVMLCKQGKMGSRAIHRGLGCALDRAKQAKQANRPAKHAGKHPPWFLFCSAAQPSKARPRKTSKTRLPLEIAPHEAQGAPERGSRPPPAQHLLGSGTPTPRPQSACAGRVAREGRGARQQTAPGGVQEQRLGGGAGAAQAMNQPHTKRAAALRAQPRHANGPKSAAARPWRSSPKGLSDAKLSDAKNTNTGTKTPKKRTHK